MITIGKIAPKISKKLAHKTMNSVLFSLNEKCPNPEFFLVRFFPHSDWIRRFTWIWKNTDQKNSRFENFHAMWTVNLTADQSYLNSQLCKSLIGNRKLINVLEHYYVSLYVKALTLLTKNVKLANYGKVEKTNTL